MRWTEYAVAMLLFSVVSMLVLYLIQRLQGYLPFNPQKLRCASVPPHSGVQHRASFTTNTNWQAYSRRSDDELLHPDGRAWHITTSFRRRWASRWRSLSFAALRGGKWTRSATSGST